MSAEIAIAIATAIAEEYKKREQAREDNHRADTIINAVSSQINNRIGVITDYLDEIELSTIDGLFRGAVNTWKRYCGEQNKLTPESKNLFEQVSIDLDGVLGAMEGKFNSALSNNLKIILFPRYLTVVGFRSVLLSEHKYRHAESAHDRNSDTRIIREMWKDALNYWTIVDQMLWDEHNRKFSGPEISGLKGGTSSPVATSCDDGYYEVGCTV